MPSDCELLRQYAERADEAAFAEVVHRHTDLVYSVAQRVTCDGMLAEDVTQGVFIQLAQQAGQLSHYDTPIGWLHTAARRRAIDAVRSEVRRQIREQKAIAMHVDSAPPNTNWKEIGPLIDEAVNQLSESDRDALLLRFFKNLSHQEVGEALHLSEDAARKRVDRALEKLRKHFARRGVTASSALLTAAMMANSVQAAPVGLATRVTGPSLAAGSAATGNLFFKILFMSTKTKLIIAVAALLIIAVTLTIHWMEPAAESVAAKPGSAVSARTIASVAVKPLTAQVEKPVMPAVNSTSSAADASPAATATNTAIAPQFVAAPQADLKTAILTGIHFLEAQDTPSLLRTLLPPSELHDGDRAVTYEDYAQQLSLEPEKADMMPKLLATLHAIQDLNPVITPDEEHATYILDPPIDGMDKVNFEKVDGFWYLK